MLFRSATILALVAVLFTIGCGRVEDANSVEKQPQEECGFVQNSYGHRVSLKSKAYFTVSQQMPPEFIETIRAAAKTWNDAIGREMFAVMGRGDAVGGWENGVHSIRWLEEWRDDKAEQQADTTLYVDGISINGSDMKINAKDFTFSTELRKGTLDMESLLLHEMGHVLGLKHDPSPDSVMYYRLSSATKRATLSTLDIAHVSCEYK